MTITVAGTLGSTETSTKKRETMDDEITDEGTGTSSLKLQEVLGQALKDKFLDQSKASASHFEPSKINGKVNAHRFYLQSESYMDNFFYGADPNFQSGVVDYFYSEEAPDNFAKHLAKECYGYSKSLLGGETKENEKTGLRKIAAMYSSAALICNILGRPRVNGNDSMKVYLKEDKLPQGDYQAYLEFPMRTLHGIGGKETPTHPAMADAFLHDRQTKTAIVFESKMAEYLVGRPSVLTSSSYLNRLSYWLHGDPRAQAPERFCELIKRVNAEIANFEIGFDALQLIKHAIGLYNELDQKGANRNPHFADIKKVILVNSVWKVPFESSVLKEPKKLQDQYKEIWAAEENVKAREEIGQELLAILKDCYPSVEFSFVFMTAQELAKNVDFTMAPKNSQGGTLEAYLNRYWL